MLQHTRSVFEEYHRCTPEVDYIALAQLDYRLLSKPYIKPLEARDAGLIVNSRCLHMIRDNPLNSIYSTSCTITGINQTPTKKHSNRPDLFKCNHIGTSCADNFDNFDFSAEGCTLQDRQMDRTTASRYAFKMPADMYVKMFGYNAIVTLPYDPVGYYRAGLLSLYLLRIHATSSEIMANLDIPWGDDFSRNPYISVEVAVTLNVKDAQWNMDLRKGLYLLNPRLQANLLVNESSYYTLWAMKQWIAFNKN